MNREELKFSECDVIVYPSFESGMYLTSIESLDWENPGGKGPNNASYRIDSIVRLIDRETNEVDYAYVYHDNDSRYSFCSLCKDVDKEMVRLDDLRNKRSEDIRNSYGVWLPEQGYRYYTIEFNNEEGKWGTVAHTWYGTKEQLALAKTGRVCKTEEDALEMAKKADLALVNIGLENVDMNKLGKTEL